VIWAILALIGVPLWLCAVAILALLVRNRSLRHRPGNISVRILPPGKTRWRGGHGLWVSDVFAWRGSPAAWREELLQVVDATTRSADAEERGHLHRLGDAPVVADLTTADGGTLRVAGAAENGAALMGPFAAAGQAVGEGRR